MRIWSKREVARIERVGVSAACHEVVAAERWVMLNVVNGMGWLWHAYGR